MVVGLVALDAERPGSNVPASSHPSAEAGGDLSRLLALSDGIFAFAMTLLVINLTVPSVPTLPRNRATWRVTASPAPRDSDTAWKVPASWARSVPSGFPRFRRAAGTRFRRTVGTRNSSTENTGE
jgi:hypothetical protein